MRLSRSYFGVLFLVASMSICVFFYDEVEVTRTIRMRCNVTKRLLTVARWRQGNFLNIMLAVFRILNKLHICSNILCTCSIFIKM